MEGLNRQAQSDQDKGKAKLIRTKANMKNARRKTLKERRRPQSMSIMIYVDE